MIQALQLILALALLVFVHELGHFLFARIFKVRVEKFYLFFNPRFSLARFKYFDGQWHAKFCSNNDDEEWAKHPETTEWGIGWLPLGGYCAIGGMVDETHKSEDLSAEVQEWEFRAKPAWQRMLIILGGILMNFVSALIICSFILWHWGEDTLPLSSARQGMYFSQILLDEGFEQHDRILSINGVEPDHRADVVQALIVDRQRDVVVQRGADTVALTMSEDLDKRIMAQQNSMSNEEREQFVLLAEWIPCVIDTVLPGFPAYNAGMQKGDSIVGIAGVATPSYYEMTQEIRLHPCDTVTVDFYRDGEPQTARLFLGDECKLGVQALINLQFRHTSYTFLESIPAGIRYGCDILVNYVKQLRLVFSKEGVRQVGGFVTIGNLFPPYWSWLAFWRMTAFISIILAFMNFLPIPGLDGGYILFLLVEMITRRTPSDKFLEKANSVGWWILIALIIYANANDIIRFFF